MAQVGSNDEETEGQKSRWTVPLRENLHKNLCLLAEYAETEPLYIWFAYQNLKGI